MRSVLLNSNQFAAAAAKLISTNASCVLMPAGNERASSYCRKERVVSRVCFFFPCFFNVREFCGHKILFLFWCLYLAFLRVKVFGSHYTKLVILDVFVNPDALLLKDFFFIFVF